MTTNPTRSTTQSLDAIAKQQAMDKAIETARKAMFRDSLKTTNSGDDFFETSVWGIRQLVETVFEAAYHEGLHTGYRQGRAHACKEADGQPAPSSPNNPTIHTDRA